MSHDTQHLTISREEANRIDEEAKRRLLAARKLSLVVDLDQTIIHAAVDPTIAEWQKDKDNPNYEAVKDVKAFQLIDDGPGMRGCWYYIKLRPGLMEFLESISQIYELHIYTMGTRQYAQQIANIVDPDRKYFGERILSRDESGSMIAKNLERLFPVDTKMVVIIDDRGDVWKWSANLIRVTPFDFFVGIGDINSSFLPKKQEIQATPALETRTVDRSNEAGGGNAAKDDGEKTANGAIENGTDSDTSALEQLVAMGGGDDPTIREIQSKGREAIISTQVEEKPLERMQREQDEKDEKEEAATAASVDASSGESLANGDSQMTATDSDSSDSSIDSSTTSPSSSPKPKARHSILRNDDQELVYLKSRLVAVHAAFFNEYDRKRLGGKGGRVAALTGKRKITLSADEDDTPTNLLFVPDVKKVMPAMKMRVLSGVTLVFSGVLPLGTDVQNADIAVWAKTFGATITEKVGRGVTHVIAARPGTAKVKQATKRGGIKIVGTNWLLDSIQQWRKLDEKPYYLVGTGPDGARGEDIEGEKIEENYNPLEEPGYPISSEDETTGIETEDEARQPERKRLKLNTGEGVARGGEGEDVVDDQSPLTIDQDEWADIDKELKEFMGSDAESDSDADSIASALSVRLGKRKRAAEETGEEESDVDGGRPAARDRGGTGLRTVANAASERGSSGGRTPATELNGDVDDAEIGREQREVEREQTREEAEEEESDDELARELEREMESMDDEEDGQEEVGFMGPIEDDG
jgi:RNA polymerase II subunit A C-terminal domain phosphatase